MTNEETKLLFQTAVKAVTPGALSALATGPGSDTTFFLTRVRQELDTPLVAVLDTCERLLTQAQAAGRQSLVPDLQQMRDAARRLIARCREAAAHDSAALEREWRQSNLGQAAEGSRDPLTKKLTGPSKGSLLLVDDCDQNTTMFALLLERQGYTVKAVSTGEEALAAVHAGGFDLVLLDLNLPGMNGAQVLAQLKLHPLWRNLPVIVLSGTADADSFLRCIEMGAEDYLPKPFNPVLLRARIEAGLEKKRLRDQEGAFFKMLEVERARTDQLLLNVLPSAIATRLKEGEENIAESFPEATVLFADLSGFTGLAAQVSPAELVGLLNELFCGFDQLAEIHGVEKIKTIGDAYMVVGGVPTPRPDHARSVAEMALDMLQSVEQFNHSRMTQLSVRIGINTGPVVAGIIGRKKFSYDLWGDTVNAASRMESHGQPGRIQITEATLAKLNGMYRVEKRGVVDVKGKGEMTTYWLLGRQ